MNGEETIQIFEELAEFIQGLKEILTHETDPLCYWQKANDSKESYRSRICQGIDGREQDILLNDIKEFLDLVVARTTLAIDLAKDQKQLIATYFYHEVIDYKILDKKLDDAPFVLPVKFRKHTLPYFLEGFVHLLRITKDQKQAKDNLSTT